ncbi:MAG: hypothetical protein HYZ16_07030 [Bacteroidetes bacterium]|jgi:hypothetical protein|nr:hypothetical protein [Bacteroidota bacterium]
MKKIGIAHSGLPYLMDDELYVIEEVFKRTQDETRVKLNSVGEDTSNHTLPSLVNDTLILIRYQDDTTQMNTYKAFLAKIMGAAGKDMKKIDIVAMNKLKGMKAKTVIENSLAKSILAFGMDTDNPNNIELRNFQDKRIIICSPIELIHSDKERKIKLWQLMKELFNLE